MYSASLQVSLPKSNSKISGPQPLTISYCCTTAWPQSVIQSVK